MPTAPMPQAPPLDGVPPSPPEVSAGGGPNPPMSQLSPGVQMSGSMQTVSMSIEAISQAAKLIDLVGQINPPFAPAAQMLIEQIKSAFKATLQQGSTGLDPSAQANIPQMAIPQAAANPVAGAQQPPPPMPSGFGQ